MVRFLEGGTLLTPAGGWRLVSGANLAFATQEQDYNKTWMADKSPDRPIVHLALSWLDHINPEVVTTHTERNYSATVFSELCRLSGVWNVDLGSQDQTASALESLLVLMIVNGMSKINQDVSVIGAPLGYGTTDEWMAQVLPHGRSAFGLGGSPFATSSSIDPEYLGFRVDATVEGYGW